ncbi:MAG: peptidoglycan editing factor PgeF [Rhodanobacteraceae bacterium]
MTLRTPEETVPELPSSWLIPNWPAPADVRAIVTTRVSPDSSDSPYTFNLGTRCGDDPTAVAHNRGLLRDVLSLRDEPRWLRQVHGTHVVIEPPHGEPEADAAVTRAPGVVLAILTADCLPVLFCADDGSEITAAHAGWRGLSAGVLENTLAAMETPRNRILAWLGPAIGAKSYEVGEEVRDAFLAHEAAAASAFMITRPGHWFCDLYTLARQRLRAAGVTRMFGGRLDTFTDGRLHSYRRDSARSGRMASLIWMLPEAA